MIRFIALFFKLLAIIFAFFTLVGFIAGWVELSIPAIILPIVICAMFYQSSRWIHSISVKQKKW